MTQEFRKLVRRTFGGIAVFVVSMVCLCLSAQATLEDVFEEIESLNTLAKGAQGKLDHLNKEELDALHNYRSTLKSIDGQRVHNRSLTLQIAKQKDVLEILTESIRDVDLIESAITPMMAQMIEGLDQLIDRDKPFLLEERKNRVSELRDLMGQFNVEESEKFAQVLRAFQIESEYGRTMDATQQELQLPDGKVYNVNILRVGRIALLYQTLDSKYTGWWNPASEEWEALTSNYTTPIKNGIKMANKQLTGGLFQIPILVPEEES